MSGITDPTEQYFKDGLWGWDGAAWRKAPLPLGYSAVVGEALSNLSLAAGSNTLSGAAVPAGEIWVVTALAVMYVGTAPASIRVEMTTVTGGIALYANYAVTQSQWYAKDGYWLLAEGNLLRCIVTVATLNDDLHFRWSGWKVSVK